jgi:endoribonuclease Dicer
MNRTIEDNLDSVILAPSANREEYAQHTHRPVFKHLMYTTPFFASTRQFPARNLVALAAVVNSINIENDPYVQSLRQRLATFQPASAEWTRIDQRLSKTITREDSYTHKGLRDFLRAAEDICCDLGPWCADWFIEKIIHRAQASTGSYHSVIEVWNKKEKHYLLSILSRVHVVPVSYEDKDVVSGVTDKVEALIECLLKEKALADADNEVYSCLVFVQRRDSVLALSELLRRHPASRSLFHVGCLLGSSNSQYRRAFLDITRELLGQSQADTLRDFRIGEKTLIISTAVAEEGIDIQACGTVVRWDIPENMVSWAQSRGRARRKKSTFVLMFDNSGEDEERILKWQKLEREMEAQFLMQRHSLRQQRPQATDPMQTDENDEQFRVNSTG